MITKFGFATRHRYPVQNGDELVLCRNDDCMGISPMENPKYLNFAIRTMMRRKASLLPVRVTFHLGDEIILIVIQNCEMITNKRTERGT